MVSEIENRAARCRRPGTGADRLIVEKRRVPDLHLAEHVIDGSGDAELKAKGLVRSKGRVTNGERPLNVFDGAGDAEFIAGGEIAEERGVHDRGVSAVPERAAAAGVKVRADGLIVA